MVGPRATTCSRNAEKVTRHFAHFQILRELFRRVTWHYDGIIIRERSPAAVLLLVRPSSRYRRNDFLRVPRVGFVPIVEYTPVGFARVDLSARAFPRRGHSAIAM